MTITLTKVGLVGVTAVSVLSLLSTAAAVATPVTPAAPPTVSAGGASSDAAQTEPVVDHDGFATFSISLPTTTKSVTITGSWGPSYTNVTSSVGGSNGTYTALIGPLTPGFYSYSLTVDGVATKDPGNSTVVHSSPTLSTLLVRGAGAEFLIPQPGQKGQLTTLNYHSNVTNTTRSATVWTPPGYNASRQPYPTFYLYHGGGGDYLDWVQQGRADVILNNLYNQHRIKPMVVVMGDGNIPGSTGLPQNDQFPTELLDNLVPAVQRTYKVSTASTDMALAGLSLGGLQTFNTLLTRLGAFNQIGDFSSGYFPAVIDQIKTQDQDLLANPAVNRKTRTFRIYIGNKADIAYQNNILTRQLFDQYGIRYQFAGSYPAAGHVWKTWQYDLNDFAPRLF